MTINYALFEIGETIFTQDLPRELQDMLLGKPVADQLNMKEYSGDSLVVKEVIPEKGIVIIGRMEQEQKWKQQSKRLKHRHYQQR